VRYWRVTVVRVKERGVRVRMTLDRRLTDTYQMNWFRSRHKVALGLNLKAVEYRLWDLINVLSDWDKDHRETFGTLKATDRTLAKYMGCSYPSVNRAKNKLIKVGLVSIDEGLLRIKTIKEVKENTHAMKQVGSSVKHDISPVKQTISSVKQNQGYGDDSSIVSYKDGLVSNGLDQEDKGLIRDYQKIIKEGDYMYLTESDMKWIDQNV
jgi:hypothetical protein